jgi:uncharacterized membrane protein YqaE (UPF0057 family)
LTSATFIAASARFPLQIAIILADRQSPNHLCFNGVNTPPAKTGGFQLRLKAGSVGHSADRRVPSPLAGEGQGEGHRHQRRFAAQPLIPTFSHKGRRGKNKLPAKAGGFTDSLSGTLKVKENNGMMDVIRIIFSIIIPPLGVFLQVGFGLQFWINVLLTILGYIPGVLHAIYIIVTRD